MEQLNKDLIIAINDVKTSDVSRLIEQGANVNTADLSGRPALSIAIAKRSNRIAEILIKNNADVNQTINNKSVENKMTPLMLAAGNNAVDITSMMIDKGADISAISESGKTALTVAVIKNDTAIIEILISKGVDVSQEDMAGEKPLILAIKHYNRRATKMLLDAGANVDITDHDKKTAIECAFFGRLDIFEMFIENCCGQMSSHKLSQVITGEMTPLMLAIGLKSVIAARSLIDAGVDTTQCGRPGNDALAMAKSHQAIEIVAMIEKSQIKNDTRQKKRGNDPGPGL